MPPLFRQISMLLNDAAAVSSLSVVYAIVVGPRRKERWRIELLLLLLAAVLVLSIYISTTSFSAEQPCTVINCLLLHQYNCRFSAIATTKHRIIITSHKVQISQSPSNFNRTYSQNSRGLFKESCTSSQKESCLNGYEKNGEGTRAVA